MNDNRSSNYTSNDSLSRKDLEIILEVNKKAIEIETCVAEQNEETMSLLAEAKKEHELSLHKMDILSKAIDEIKKQNETLSKDIFKLQVLFVGSLMSLIVQIVQIFLKQ